MRQGGTSTEWRKLRGVVFRTMGNACVKCGDTATEVDHIVELDAGGTDDLENLQPLCTACHRVKTSAYNSKRMTKRIMPRNNGFFYKDVTPATLPQPSLSPRLTIEPPISQRKEKSSNDARN